MRATPNPKTMLALLWVAAASVGLLVAAVPVVDENASSRLLGGLLVLATLPFGFLRPSVPALWAVAIGWPTVVTELSQDSGWQAVLLIVYPMVGVYLGDWIGTWWAERNPTVPVRASDPAPPAAADGTAAGADGLPPVLPGRYTQAARRADEEARHDGDRS
ncbi:MAG: hypothetical protein ACT4P1_18135 [Sporichthyaceae bacterium]